MRRNLFKTAIASLLFAVVLLGGYSCSDDDPYYPDDYLTEAQVRKMIEDALRENSQSGNYLTEDQVKKIIEDAIKDNIQNGSSLTETQIRMMIEDAIRQNGQNGTSLTEEELKHLIEEAIKENNQQLEFTQWRIVNISVEFDHWDWNPDAGRYEAIYDLPELSEFIYENGAILGYAFIGQQGVDEVQKLLPYVYTYPVTDAGGNITATYTETISFDVQYAPNEKSTVAFFIQASDLFRADEYLDNYNFRLVMIW